ncbi:prominin-2-like [Rhinoraja longicauda]
MELCRGRAGFLVALAGIFLVARPSEAENCTADSLEFTDMPQHNFSRLDGDAGSIEPLYNMVNLYLDAVQPNPFPTDIIRNALRVRDYINQNYQEVVRYEAGYLVSFIIGVLLFIFVPLVGSIFCCCRCCGECGGKVKERTKSTDCQRNTLAVALLVTTIVILAGVACAFTANQRLTKALDPSLATARGVLVDVSTYIKSILVAIPQLIAEFSVPQDKIFSEFDRVNETLGLMIRDALAPVVGPVLMMVSRRIADISTLQGHLTNISTANSSLAQTQAQLAAELSIVKGNLNSTLTDPRCIGCNPAIVATNDLQANPIYSLPPEVQVVFSKAMSFSTASLTDSLQQANRTFNELPARVNRQTVQNFTVAKTVINRIEISLSSNVVKVQFPDSLQNVVTLVNSSQIEQSSAQLKQYDYYRWVVSIVLCCIILLIIACNALGLGLGTAGIATREDVHRGNACSESGANFLMAGVGFSFIFTPLLVLLVFVTFFVGGNVRTLGCKPWETGEIYQAIDELTEQISEYDLSQFFNASVSFSSLHRHCEEGRSLLLLLPSRQIADLERYLNIDTYSGDIIQNIDRLNVDVSDIVLLSSTSRRDLLAFASNGIAAVNYTSLTVSDNNLTKNLLDLASNLDQLGQTQTDPTIGANLSRQATRLQEIAMTLAVPLQLDLVGLHWTFSVWVCGIYGSHMGRCKQLG